MQRTRMNSNIPAHINDEIDIKNLKNNYTLTLHLSRLLDHFTRHLKNQLSSQ